MDVQLTSVTLDGWFVWFFFLPFLFLPDFIETELANKIVYIEVLQCDGSIYAYIVK